MKDYIIHDEWSIIEEGFNPENQRVSESIFSIGNGRMGQRANFEEKYTGDSLRGSYVAGVYYPDKTKVGWWKNGYPEYFAKVLNAPNWIGISVFVDDMELDLHTCTIVEFRRELNMQKGFLYRNFTAEMPDGKQIAVESYRFCSIAEPDAGLIQYSIQSVNFSGTLKVVPYLDADIINTDSNYDEKFWEEVDRGSNQKQSWITAKTKKLDFQVCTGMQVDIVFNGEYQSIIGDPVDRDRFVSKEFSKEISPGDQVTLYKYAAVVSSENHSKTNLIATCQRILEKVYKKGFVECLKDQEKAWKHKWSESDIVILGDVAAQQGIRFNIFQLNQTYTGEDHRLNIGPKGFTGEKYGGSTYWDTEAYCLPFYMSTADPKVAENLLLYRYNHLKKAIENAELLGFKDGAALYPMVTMNGEECHNEWEITFEEIHRNGAIVYAIFDYIRYTGDEGYLLRNGLEVLIAICRFWAQRVNFSNEKNQYVILGVTGPNEYENNVNNNWYTNHIAVWCMEYTMECLEKFRQSHSKELEGIIEKTGILANELDNWKNICENMYYPEDSTRGIFLQQDGFLDKDIRNVTELPKEDYPINQNWSWDRILRSCYIKQADVLQGFYFFEHKFDLDKLKRNFDFYEPLTVHESSLSPCVHSILASRLGYLEKAYEMYLRTARLDLDDYNNDTEDGCHITSMAGTWMSIVKGFGGLQIIDHQIHLNPFIPNGWEAYSFKINFRNHILNVKVSQDKVEISNRSTEMLRISINGTFHQIEPEQVEEIVA